MDVFLIGAFTSPFGKRPEADFKALTREAVTGVLADAGLDDGRAIDTVHFANSFMHHWGQHLIRGNVCLAPLVEAGLLLRHTPVFNVEGACAGGSIAFRGAVNEVRAGSARLALAVGVEKLFDPDNPTVMQQLFDGGFDSFDRDRWMREYRDTAAAAGFPYAPGPGRPVTMDTYAIQAAWHMATYGTTVEQIAAVAAKNHAHAVHNPKAQYRTAMTVEQVLADKPIAAPLTRAMCAPMSDGAAAVLVCDGATLATLPAVTRQRAVRLRANVFTGGSFRQAEEPSLTRPAVDRAYAMAGLGPEDIDVVEVHDATSFCEIYQTEMLRLCPEGGGGAFAAAGETALGGRVPVNPSGGLVSKGHPLAATGLSMLTELVTQLRGEAGARQVAGARIALQQNGGGTLGLEEAVCSITILERRG
ncbi:thiolase family protein [Pseudodonghicola flavimaris]|uniref:propanoyl-CoA C-acyltransferase n=1 Tax=Pseudodonghicola flavimaris TaxID=3050036 RepID=A0ABT7F206_9RHOB|nr:thiolase family protein [Pseudodonghicola flavimaris]MDK3018637.1 thiolase family protein [Pseudodonghicola flavimaris]